MSEQNKPKDPIGEIIQPFIDLIHAPRALWGINLAYVLEGMVYFGMLGYLAMHFSDFIFQGMEHADEYSHNMVMVLTAGITLAMVLLGGVADKRGVRFALILAFVFMVAGRGLISGAPNILGFEPTRPGVMAGDEVDLHITKLADHNAGDILATEQERAKDIYVADAKVIALDEDAADVDAVLSIDLAAGGGIAPGPEQVYKLVQLSQATVICRIDDVLTVRYGDNQVVAKVQSRSAADLCVEAGSVISLGSAVVMAKPVEDDDSAEEEYEYFLRCQWAEDFASIDQSGNLNSKDATILEKINEAAEGYRSTDAPSADDLKTKVDGILAASGREDLAGDIVAVASEQPLETWVSGTYDVLSAKPHPDGGADTCEPKDTITIEEDQKVKERWTVDGSANTEGADEVDIAALRNLDAGATDIVLRDVHVSYVRNAGYFVQKTKDGPGLYIAVSPVWSQLHIMTMLGIFLVVIGYGLYQPAAYAGVRQFTTPKTAAMGFAMLYALMNLGGYLPSWAFLLRDEDFAGLGITGTYWFYTACTVVALFATIMILSRKTVAEAIKRAKEETAAIEAAEGKPKEEKKEEAKANVSELKQVVPVHLWLLAIVSLAVAYYKLATPSNKATVAAVIGVLAVAWVILCIVFGPTRRYLANHPLADTKFSFFIFCLIPVQTLFVYNWMILPQYISRSYEGWIGEYFELAANANPILIFIAVPLIAAATQKAKVYNMMIIGTFVMAAPAFLLAIGPYGWTLAGYLLIMTIGEAMWQPRFLQYAAEIAPEGRTGQYMGVAQLPWFATKMLVPMLYSGWMLDRYCPADGQLHTEWMWFYFACLAMCSTLLLVLAKGWIGRDFKTKAE